MRFFGRRRTAEVADKLDDQTDQNMTDMTDMAATLSGLQDEMAVVNAPAANHFKPWWLLAAIIVAAIIGTGTFIAVDRITEVDRNTRDISEGCAIRNEALTVINQKFNQLNVLFDASLAMPRDPTRPPPTDEILRLYAEFKKPIPLKSCKESP